jgi:1-phosphatidylinositol-4-phosphate 5-kinase
LLSFFFEQSQSRTIFPFESPPSKQASYFLDALERISKEPPLDLPPPPAEVVFQVDGKYRFRDFRPATFQKLRFLVGMSDEEYLHIISQPTQEKLSEGRSGAFFFVCGEGDLVVKTVESHEAGTLLSILDQYATHLMKNPASLLVRFLGLHAIRMYGNEFTFVVMKNIFPRGLQLNEKYDIKGSYVQRNAAMKFPGKLSTCRYCHEQFIEGSSDRCPEVIGSHEAIVTLKDNDMINKIRLSPEDAYQIIDTLFSDSDALCEMGLMDYSLLVGVKHAYYDLDLFRPRDSLGDNSNGNQSNSLLPGSSSLSRPQQLPQQSIQGSGLGSSLASLSAALEAGPVLGRYQQNAYAARAVIAPNEYYFGVIDILTTWSWSKKLERFFKVFVLGQPADGVSCVDPVEFKERYQRKITRIIEHEGFVREITGSWVGKR